MKKILKSLITSKFVEQLSDVYNFFLTVKFSKIKQNYKLTLKRLQKMLFDTELFSQERELILKLLYRRKAVLVWNFNKIDKIRSKIMKNQKIRTMLHKVWQIFDFSVPKILEFIVVNILQKRINIELLKSCFESYRNSWFLINKKIKNKYQIINVAMNMNEIIIRDINLSFNVEEFSKEFAKMCVAFLIDFFSEYDQVILIEKSRDLTAFMISLSLLRMTRLSQSAINSMTQFVRIIIEILKKHIVTSRCWSFVDDINVKNSRSNYNEKEVLFKIRLFIMKHVQ